jgi:ribose 5-phosphate isomerase B
MRRFLVTEKDVADLASGVTLRIPVEALVTPAAQDLIRRKNIRLVRGPESRGASSGAATPRAITAKVALGADHGGFELKEGLKRCLVDLGCQVTDCGTDSPDPVDYPDIARAVAERVGTRQDDFGIVIDGAGIGSCMVANKVRGVRAALCHDLSTARNAREHNNANVLTLGGRLVGRGLAEEIVHMFLSTPFAGGRHAGRVDKIDRMDSRS